MWTITFLLLLAAELASTAEQASSCTALWLVFARVQLVLGTSAKLQKLAWRGVFGLAKCPDPKIQAAAVRNLWQISQKSKNGWDYLLFHVCRLLPYKTMAKVSHQWKEQR